MGKPKQKYWFVYKLNGFCYCVYVYQYKQKIKSNLFFFVYVGLDENTNVTGKFNFLVISLENNVFISNFTELDILNHFPLSKMHLI
jgi:hypothetical protein